MRILCLALVLLLGSLTPAAAQWREYVYEPQGFAIQFPAMPRVGRGTYMSARFGTLPSTTYEVQHENILYRLTVVDFPNVGEGANLMGEAAYTLMREGEVTFYDFPRVDLNTSGVYGIGMQIDLMDQRRLRTSVYFNRGRFYKAEAYILPARGDRDMAVPSRFDQTLRFNVGGR
jgi:hypothetical protein